jgi:hypothetical protein
MSTQDFSDIRLNSRCLKSLDIFVLLIQGNGHPAAHRLCLVFSTACLKNGQSRAQKLSNIHAIDH